MKNKNLTRTLLGTAFVLLIPIVAMQFTDEVNWDVADFIVMGVLLLTTGLAMHFAIKKFTKPVHRFIVLAVIVTMFLLVWADLAVGVFNIPGISGS